MTDRVRKLLEFDLAVRAAIASGRGVSQAHRTTFPEERGTGSGPIRLVGFDEAGRGALAGPVAVGCIRIDLECAAMPLDRELLLTRLSGLDDSKRLSRGRRETLYEAIARDFDWGLGCASAVEIDREGIVAACRLAARRALAQLTVRPNAGLLDRGLSLAEERPVVLSELQFTRGDSRSFHIAAASIVAKVGRDRILEEIDRRFPGYGFAAHKGYGTAGHRAAIGRLGPSYIHRRSFLSRIKDAQSQSC